MFRSEQHRRGREGGRKDVTLAAAHWNIAKEEDTSKSGIESIFHFFHPWSTWHKWINTHKRSTSVGRVLTSVTAETSAPLGKIDREKETHLRNIQNKDRYSWKVSAASAAMTFKSIYKAGAGRFLQRGHVRLIFGLSPRLKLHIRSEENQALW